MKLKDTSRLDFPQLSGLVIMGSLPRFNRPCFEILLDQHSSSPSTIRSLPDLIEYNAQENPSHVFCIQSKQSKAGAAAGLGFINVTFEELKEAVERCCLWLLQHIPDAHQAQSSSDGSCLLLSIRLSSEAVRHLVSQTRATTVIASSRTRPAIEDVLSKEQSQPDRQTNLETAESFEHFLRLPKAIPLTHRYLLGYATCHEFPPGEDMSQQGVNLSTLPLFHGFGALAPCLALSVGKPVCFPPASTIVNCNLVTSIAKNRDITSLMTVPSILEDFTHMGEFDVAAQILARLKFVACGGGGLKLPVGMALESKGVTLLNHFGATELGALAPIFQPESGYDWRYLRVRSDLGLELETLEPKSRLCKLVGYPFAWNTNFELQDRLERNPLNEREVKILGRNDDLIVLATGEKVLPHPLEQAIEQHPLVRRAIAFGNGQTELGLLVDPMDEKLSADDLVEEIWPSVLAANSLMDHHAWVSARSAILVKPSDKSIPLSDKGSAQRREVYKIFETEIASVYQRLEASQAGEGVAPLDLEQIEGTLRSMAQLCLPLHARLDPSDDDEDFVNLGMDSLKATKFRRLLNASLRKSGHEVYGCQDLPSDFIYAHPSISRLAKALKGPIGGSISAQDAARVMKALTSKYAIMSDKSESQGKPQVIVLTGSTGNLGAHMLAQMAELDGISRVICMLRPQGASLPGQLSNDLAQRQKKALKERGMQVSEKAWSKIHLLPWQAGKEFLGLEEDVYQDLAAQVTHIFHGAWPMDFKMKVSSFEPQIKAVRDLIELARLAHCKRPSVKARLVLASSIAVLGCYSKVTSSGPVVPEVTLNDPSVALPLGYAQAKWCCEKMIENAQECIAEEIECMIVRIGQISGSQTMGYWSPKEHFPALVKACQDVKAVPNLQGTLSWIPVDQAAQVAIELLFNSKPPELVYHLENPIRQPWPDVCTVLEANLSIPIRQRLPFQKWLDMVAAHDDTASDLLEFLRDHFLHMSAGSLVLDTKAKLEHDAQSPYSGPYKMDSTLCSKRPNGEHERPSAYLSSVKTLRASSDPTAVLSIVSAASLFQHIVSSKHELYAAAMTGAMERPLKTVADAAQLLQISELITSNIRRVIDAWADEATGSKDSKDSKTLPSPALHEAQRTLLAATGTLVELVSEPSVRVLELACQYWESRALYIAAERRIPDLLATEPLSASELSARVGIEQGKLDRVMRCLCSNHVFKEVGEALHPKFANNGISQALVGNEPLRAYVFNLDLFTAADHLPRTLLSKDKGPSYKVEETAFQDAVGTKKSRWEWLEEKVPPSQVASEGVGYPGLMGFDQRNGFKKDELVARPELEVFGLAMLGGGQVFGAAHPYDYPWDKLGKATVVDVGGGVGGFDIQLSRLYKDLKFVIQDRLPVIQQGEHSVWPKENPAALAEGR
ncbi:MAG: hypothetical protein Q9212_002492, partial [Teloschistes hypoglaucus]